ncbi:hypothetical protein GOV11_04960 [Candidatus Woesearchaeota archaeon]|nr:hypothetical protein [Candidatus Woesearchaeota archaeon]
MKSTLASILLVAATALPAQQPPDIETAVPTRPAYSFELPESVAGKIHGYDIQLTGDNEYSMRHYIYESGRLKALHVEELKGEEFKIHTGWSFDDGKDMFTEGVGYIGSETDKECATGEILTMLYGMGLDNYPECTPEEVEEIKTYLHTAYDVALWVESLEPEDF